VETGVTICGTGHVALAKPPSGPWQWDEIVPRASCSFAGAASAKEELP